MWLAQWESGSFEFIRWSCSPPVLISTTPETTIEKSSWDFCLENAPMNC
jgi:hypothetical protein